MDHPLSSSKLSHTTICGYDMHISVRRAPTITLMCWRHHIFFLISLKVLLLPLIILFKEKSITWAITYLIVYTQSGPLLCKLFMIHEVLRNNILQRNKNHVGKTWNVHLEFSNQDLPLYKDRHDFGINMCCMI